MSIHRSRLQKLLTAAGLPAIVMLLAAACTPVTGNPGTETGTTLAIQGTRPGTSAAGSASFRSLSRAPGDAIVLDVTDADGIVIGTITLTEARIVVEEFEFESETESENDSLPDQETGFEFEGPYLADLVAETVSPSIETVEVPEGVYEKIEFSIHTIDGSEDDEEGTPLVLEDDPLYGNSIRLSGTYTGETADGAVTDVPFSLTLDVDESVELKTSGETAVGFTVDAEELNRIIVAFRLAGWFDFSNPETNALSVDFTDLTVSGEEIVLDTDSEGAAASIVEVIRENIEKSADYGKDLDDDGKLEMEEDDDPDSEDEDDY